MKSSCLLLFFYAVIGTSIQEKCVDVFKSSECERLMKRENLYYCYGTRSRQQCARSCGHCVTSTLPKDACGLSTVAQSRIVNGETAQPGAWPWIASLNSGGHFCGGTLIAPNWILTAGHCVRDTAASEITVHLGVHNRYKSSPAVQKIKVQQIIRHPNYSSKSIRSDLALLKLEKPAILNDRVRVPCLPTVGVYPSIGKQCYLAGWGTTEHPGNAAKNLQQTKLPVVLSRKCIHNREVVCVGKGFDPRPDGSQQPNACRGDSGGPLVCQQTDGRWQLEGVASFVYKYCKYYTGYSPVNKYLPWIKSHVTGL